MEGDSETKKANTLPQAWSAWLWGTAASTWIRKEGPQNPKAEDPSPGEATGRWQNHPAKPWGMLPVGLEGRASIQRGLVLSLTI